MRTALAAAIVISLFPALALAHVVVKPSEVLIGSFQTFTVGVPVEKSSATIGLRLLIPEGLQYVSPNVKPGWRITTKKDKDGNVTEISWTGGRIPEGQRDDFVFSAKVPSDEAKIAWKAYQTSADGSIVSWDVDPTATQATSSSAQPDFSKQGPFSVTKVIDDLSSKSDTPARDPLSSVSLALSVVALVLALSAIRRSHTH